MTDADIPIQRGTDNVFADLGFPDADSHLLKAQLVARLAAILKDLGLTQVEAARRMGVSQPDISRLLRGQFRDVSVERLLRMMVKVGCAVDIVVHPTPGGPPAAPIPVA
ncbi:helix-turn-helix domain-containing protein [Niveispirillum sp. SYP-B3756]|uniref:helix-turn-helix domain-containing protein n=1 Tax=Niveispirillum sp. SYP-B3756 TaxID=2662178 RepID=UPI001291854C|nr:helix-turn-helix transcriptional regulator [Niveispirillum sp. SYP-B3756]MQP63828.1 helix-turn-helix domain-containing protein [Niveispirillum sp. SYP-B3756]